MTDEFRAVLSPLLFISYVTGIRIIEFPVGEPKPWLSVTYILVLWSVYFLLYVYTVFHYVSHNYTLYYVCFWLDIFTTILSVILAVYYDKKLRNCLRKLSIVEDTLEKLGTMTDYQKLYTRVVLIIFGWFTLVIFKTYNNSLHHRDRCESVEAFYISFIIDYCPHINLIDDLIIASILGYIEQKFDQVNEHLQKLDKSNNKIKRTCEHFVKSKRQAELPKYSNNECVSWTVIHLHLELRRISRELNSIFGLQMTVKMGSYFTFLALGLWEIVNLILVTNYATSITLSTSTALTVFFLYMFRLILINYMCERVTIKANATGDFINKISYSSSDVAVRENIAQFVLQLIQTPVGFYGLGFFQFGLKFLYGFYSSITTVTIILIQSRTNGRQKNIVCK